MENLDIPTFTNLVDTQRWAAAGTLLHTAQAKFSADEIAAHPECAKAIGQLVAAGGEETVASVSECLRRGGESISSASADEILAMIHRSACRMAVRALRRQDLLGITTPYGVMLELPRPAESQRCALVECYRSVLDRAEAQQNLVLERTSALSLRQVMSGERTCVIATLGTDAPFRALDELLKLAVVADAYPGLGDQLLSETLCRAQWPITGCLSRGLEHLFRTTLIRFFVTPSERSDFTRSALTWLRLAVCDEPAEHGAEPPENFSDD